jgi:hypothetical protein
MLFALCIDCGGDGLGHRAFSSVYVSGLGSRTPESVLTALCESMPDASAAWIAVDPETGAFWGHGFIAFPDAQAATAAAARLHGRHFRGLLLAACTICSRPPDDECRRVFGGRATQVAAPSEATSRSSRSRSSIRPGS